MAIFILIIFELKAQFNNYKLHQNIEEISSPCHFPNLESVKCLSFLTTKLKLLHPCVHTIRIYKKTASAKIEQNSKFESN